jgi:UDP-N-acetylmuramate--alanine ligase
VSDQRYLGSPKTQHVHVVGVGGIGMSAIARILRGWGYRVSGSDSHMSELTAELQAEGILVYSGHRPEHVEGADLVVRSSAVRVDNVEVLAAQKAGIPVVRRAQVLGEMMADRYGIAVAGTHGKTTTTAMLSFVLTELGLDPSYIVGGVLQNTGLNARVGLGPYFVIEADEYDRTFLGLTPSLAVVTVVEMDHPDCFADIADVESAFAQFLQRVPAGGTVVGCRDQAVVDRLLDDVSRSRSVDAIGYGLRSDADWMALDATVNTAGGSDFDVTYKGQPAARLRICLPGLHNVSNSLAVLACAQTLGLDLDEVADAMSRFTGVHRRFEVKGEVDGFAVIDDYAHHPTEIRATLAAARRRFDGRRIWAVFQPHTYSRTRALLDDFAKCFSDADHVLVTDIYAAREAEDTTISSRDLVGRIEHDDARYVATLAGALEALDLGVQPGDVVVTMGAGDGYLVGEKLLAIRLQRHGAIHDGNGHGP